MILMNNVQLSLRCSITQLPEMWRVLDQSPPKFAFVLHGHQEPNAAGKNMPYRTVHTIGQRQRLEFDR